MDDLLEKLNDEQREAVLHDEGPLLILAGAGAGKTRVITYRIAYLICVRGIWPSNILAITFTNKAANEMRERINTLIGDTSRNMWVGTFHSMFARILRRHAELLDYTPTYSILDSEWPKVGAGFEAWLSEANQSDSGQLKTLTECRD